jgi:hypothetical protein
MNPSRHPQPGDTGPPTTPTDRTEPARTDTLHIVAAPATGRPHANDQGRLSPLLLLAHALREGRRPPGPVLLVGPEGCGRTAAGCGLHHDATITLPLGQPRLGRPALLARTRRLQRLVCWSDELAPLVHRAADEVHLVSTDPDRCPGLARHFARITTLTEHDAALWRQRGAAPVRANAWVEAIRRTPVDPGPGVDRLRDRLGPEEILITALEDRPSRTDARGLAFLLSVLSTNGYPICGLVPSIAGNVHAARRHIAGLIRGYRLLVTEEPLPALLGAVDMVVMPEEPQTGASVILQAAAEARGCRVIRLSHRGKAGLKSTPGTAAPVLENLDAILAERRLAAAEAGETVHA